MPVPWILRACNEKLAAHPSGHWLIPWCRSHRDKPSMTPLAPVTGPGFQRRRHRVMIPAIHIVPVLNTDGNASIQPIGLQRYHFTILYRSMCCFSMQKKHDVDILQSRLLLHLTVTITHRIHVRYIYIYTVLTFGWFLWYFINVSKYTIHGSYRLL